MTIEMIKAMFDACYLAGRTRAMLPALPEGVTSSYIHYLDVIDSLERQGLRKVLLHIFQAQRFYFQHLPCCFPLHRNTA